MCWPANTVAAFSVLLILFDLVLQQWSYLVFHALGGIVATGVFWLLCSFLGSQIAGAILYVPLIFLFVFALGILFTGESLKRQGCCLNCPGGSASSASDSSSSDSASGSSSGSDSASGSDSVSGSASIPNEVCELEKRKLKGTPLL